jgi:ubiquitin carboxyl-terminal hydrolase L3
MNSLTPAAFKALFGVSGDEWKEYYSPSLWDSMKARIAFVNPDKKPLPGIISIPSSNGLHVVSKTALGIATAPQMPRPESLAVMVAAVCDAAALAESDSVDGPVQTHPELIVSLYATLVNRSADSGDDGLAAVAKRRSDTVKAVDRALEVSGPPAQGLTRKMFWIQHMLAALEQTESHSSLDAFMNANPHLAYADLPLMYYSEMIINSSEAQSVFIPPDRRRFPSLVSTHKAGLF